MSSFLDDSAVAERVLGHVAAGSTDRGEGIWREPVANYRSAQRLERELRHVLGRFLSPFCPSAALPEPGSFVAREAAGTPLLVVRGKDGRVRAFRNACRHRGAAVADGTGCVPSFVCPYHGWVYRLDGRLRTVPHEAGFPGLDKASHGLVAVRAEEKLGLVFVAPHAEPREASGTDELPTLLAPDQRLLRSNEFVVEANWKIFLEGFLEGYHIRFAHKRTFYPYGYDNLTLIEHCGAHSRVTFPFRRIEDLANVEARERRVDGRVTYVYHLFPNALVTVLSHHTNLLVLEPHGVERTRVFSYQLTNRDAGPSSERAERDAAFVGETGAVEDLELVTSVQRSLGSGANEFFTFGHYESAIAHFHRQLGGALEDSPSASRTSA